MSGKHESDIKSYISEIIKKPLLSRSEERRICLAIQKGGEPGTQARNKMIESNMRLVISHAKNYLGCGLTLEDLIQEGSIGLMTAVERFNYTLGYRFSTYAMHWIRQSIGRAIDAKAKSIRLPTHILETRRKVSHAKYQLSQSGEFFTTEDVAIKAGVSTRKVEIIDSLPDDSLSLDGDCLETLIYNPEVAVELDSSVINAEIEQSLSVLSDDERLIMLRRFQILDDEEFGEGSILANTATELGWSKEKVRLVESAALRKLRAHARHQKLKERMEAN